MPFHLHLVAPNDGELEDGVAPARRLPSMFDITYVLESDRRIEIVEVCQSQENNFGSVGQSTQRRGDGLTVGPRVESPMEIDHVFILGALERRFRGEIQHLVA